MDYGFCSNCFCRICNNLSEDTLCHICSDEGRDRKIICVVEEPKDVIFLEKSGEYKGVYHVLLGALSPLSGIGPKELKIKELENVFLVLITQNPLMEEEESRDQIITKLFGEDNPFDLILAGEDKLNLINTHFDSETILNGVIIGDLPNDVYVADILKIPCYGVTWGYSEEGELDTPFIADEFSELLEMVKEHLVDLAEGKVDEELEEIEFEEIEFDEDF